MNIRLSALPSPFPAQWWRTGLLSAGLVALAAALTLAPVPLAAAGLLAAGAGVALLLYPAIGLSLIALAIPLGQLIPLPFGAAGAGIVDVLILATAGAWWARRVVQRDQAARLWRPPLVPLLGVFLWVTAASLTQAASWREGIPEWIKWAEFAAVYFVSTQLLTRRGVFVLLLALLAAGVSQSALGAYQFITQSGPEAFILGSFMRAHGTLQQPNPYAGYLGYLAPVAASLTLAACGGWWRQHRPRMLGLALAAGAGSAALIAGIMMSWSRGAWLGLTAALTAVAGLRSKKAATITLLAAALLIAVIVVAGAGWLPDQIEERVRDLGAYISGPDPARTEINDANFSVLERLAHWQAGWRMFSDHPWLGVGIGNYGTAYDAYGLPHWYAALGHAHNIFINFLAETGIIGAGAFLLLWLAIGWTAARQIPHGGLASALAAGVLGVWVYLTVHNLFDNLFVQHLQLQLALLLGALATLTGAGQSGHGASRKPTTRPIIWPEMNDRATYPKMTTELPSFLTWLIRLPLLNRLGLEQRPREVVRFFKFAAVGAFGAVVDMTVLNVLHKVFGMHLLAANTISVSVAIVSNFVWNRLWTFPESRERSLATQLGKFTIVNVIGLGINNIVFWAMTHVMATFIHDPWNYNLAKITAIGVVLFWNFFINRTWTYRGIE